MTQAGMTQTLRQRESYGIFPAFGSSVDCTLGGEMDPANQSATGALLLMTTSMLTVYRFNFGKA